jgi:hypothetical protein
MMPRGAHDGIARSETRSGPRALRPEARGGRNEGEEVERPKRQRRRAEDDPLRATRPLPGHGCPRQDSMRHGSRIPLFRGAWQGEPGGK